jgi:NHL repeat-containing protein
MKRSITLAVVFAALFAGSPASGQSKAKAQNVPEIPYDSVANFFKLPPGLYFGEGIGVATNSKGHVFVYTRSGETRLFEFDQTGAFVRELGQGLYGLVFAHAVRVDRDDNVWVVDEGSNMVVKFNPSGRVVMTLGRRPEALEELANVSGQGGYTGANKPYSFNRPTDVAWDAQGNIFVSDGYGDSRIVKYDKSGRFIKSAGVRGNQPGQLNLPHTLAADAQGNIYIGDRGNARVQVWDNDLNPKTIYDQVGSPWAVCVSPGPHQYLFVSNSVPDNGDSRVAAQTGEIYKMELDGTILGKFGKAGKALKEFSTVHEIDCRNPNELFVAEITAWRAQKITLRPQAGRTTAGQ